MAISEALFAPATGLRAPFEAPRVEGGPLAAKLDWAAMFAEARARYPELLTVDAPAADAGRRQDRLGQEPVEGEAGHDHEAELTQMTAHAFAVIELEAPMLQVAAQGHEAHIGGIALAREHALPEKGAAQGNAIQAANQSIAIPDLNGMGMIHAMQRGIQG